MSAFTSETVNLFTLHGLVPVCVLRTCAKRTGLNASTGLGRLMVLKLHSQLYLTVPTNDGFQSHNKRLPGEPFFVTYRMRHTFGM